jgi:hypothetical protein
MRFGEQLRTSVLAGVPYDLRGSFVSLLAWEDQTNA